MAAEAHETPCQRLLEMNIEGQLPRSRSRKRIRGLRKLPKGERTVMIARLLPSRRKQTPPLPDQGLQTG